jgi:hypothetical protein
VLLANETNHRLADLLHGETHWLEGRAAVTPPASAASLGGITSDSEEQELSTLNDWIGAQGLPRGMLSFDFADPSTGEQQAVFDLAWPTGLQEELSQPVAVLLNEGAEILALASQDGFLCFTATDDFKAYVMKEILAIDVAA